MLSKFQLPSSFGLGLTLFGIYLKYIYIYISEWVKFTLKPFIVLQAVSYRMSALFRELNTGILVRDYLEIHQTCSAPGKILRTRSRSRLESSNKIKIETRIVKWDWDRDKNCRTRSTREPSNMNTTLWVWGRSLAPRGSSITNTKLQRRRAIPSDSTKCKEKTIDYFQQSSDQA